MDESPKIKSDTTVASAKRSLKSAGLLVAKKAERTKLATVTLPRAYLELGKAVYKDAAKRIVFADQCRKLDALLNERKKIHEDAKAKPTASTLTEKARQVASDAQDLAKTKAIDLKVFQAFASLGESAYSELGRNAGLAEVVEPIAMAVERRDALDHEMAGIEAATKGQWITPRRFLIAGGMFLGLMALAMITPSQTVRDAGGSGARRSVHGSDDQQTAESTSYKQGFEQGRRYGETFATVMAKHADKPAVLEKFREEAKSEAVKFRSMFTENTEHMSLLQPSQITREVRNETDRSRGYFEGFMSVVSPHLQ